MEENWCALFIATQYIVTPEQAFQIYWDGKKKKYANDIDKNEVFDMIKLKKDGLKYKEIGEMYGISSNAVYRRIEYYTKKRKLKC